MSIHERMEFAENGLEIRYCGSASPQLVSIHVRTANLVEYAHGPTVIRTLTELIESGAAGGEHYPPQIGRAKVVSQHAAEGPDFHWQLEFTGVCALFIRNIVERLRVIGGWDNPVVAMAIVGNHWNDTSSDCVTTIGMLEWLNDPRAYPGVWTSLSYESSVSLRNIVGAELVVNTVAPISMDVGVLLEALCYTWLSTVLDYADESGSPIVDDIDRQERLMPRCSWGSTEFCAAIEEHQRNGKYSAQVLQNLLERFHHNVTPIRKANIRL